MPAIEVRKLAVWDKMRWVAGDMKDLKHLLETLRHYNSELANVLPSGRFRSLERRVERELTTCPNLTGRLASLGINDDDNLGHPAELRQANYYRTIISLLERRSEPRVTTVEGSQNGQDCEMGSRTPRLSSSLSPRSLRLRLAEITLPKPLSSGSAVAERDFVVYQQMQTIVEWRYYSTTASAHERSYIDARVHNLSMQLYQLSSVSDTGLLSCLGYVHDEVNSRYGNLFAYPEGVDGALGPMSLRERLRHDHERRLRCELKERFDLARSLILAIYRLLSVNWLHKNLSSESVLLFTEKSNAKADDDGGACQLFVCGFARSRRDGQFELSEKTPAALNSTICSNESLLYMHPDQAALFEAASDAQMSSVAPTTGNLLTASYRREFDVYSLGVLLLEIGFWCPIQRIARDFKSKSPTAFASKLRTQYVPDLEGRMGRTYTNIVAYCLSETSVDSSSTAVGTNSDDEYLVQMKRFLNTFEEKVVTKIEGSYLGAE